MESASRATGRVRRRDAAVLEDPRRLAALRRTALLDTPPDPAFDRLCRLTARLLGAPAAVISLVDATRQFVKGHVGLPEPWATTREAPLSHSFGVREVTTGRPFAVGEGRLGPIVPAGAATRDSAFVAHLGAPLLHPEGHALGSLFVLDRRQRRWTTGQVELIVELAASVSSLVELRALTAAVQRLQRLERLREDFTRLFLHDLQQPVAVVVGQSQLLRRRIERGEPLDAPSLLTGLTRIERGVEHIRTQANELVGVHAPELAEPRPRQTDLVDLAAGAVADHEELSDRHTIRLEIAVSELPALVDAQRLLRVLGNLLSNAIKYSPTGGEIVVSVRREESEEGSWGVVSVADRGVGIPAEDLPRIGERFFRAGNVVGAIEGQGLGLDGARQTVESHGGTLGIESVEGTGTTVTIRLPLRTTRPPRRTDDPPPEE